MTDMMILSSKNEFIGLSFFDWNIRPAAALRHGTGECPAIGGHEVAQVAGRWRTPLERPEPRTVDEAFGERFYGVSDGLVGLAVGGG
jgi:hypothetical protein